MFGLFKDDGDAGNDALKFQAPKASALKKQQKAELDRQNSSDNTKTAVSDHGAGSQGARVDSVQRSPSAPQILFSSSIYLYRVNSAGAYDVVEGGTKLGCVVIGTGAPLGFQILVYNGQKVPQAQIPVTPSTDYSFKDLYLSCSDGSGGQFSLLFDSHSILGQFIRVVVITKCYIHMHSGGNTVVKGPLERGAGSSSSMNDQVLETGMSAGVAGRVWPLDASVELGNPAKTLLESVAMAPVGTVQDVCKVKVGDPGAEVGSGLAPVGGLGLVCEGFCKGDRILAGIPVSVASRGSLDLGNVPEGAFVIAELEIIKVKTGSDRKEKKGKKEMVADVEPKQPGQVPLAQVATVAPLGGADFASVLNNRLANPAADLSHPTRREEMTTLPLEQTVTATVHSPAPAPASTNAEMTAPQIAPQPEPQKALESRLVSTGLEPRSYYGEERQAAPSVAHQRQQPPVQQYGGYGNPNAYGGPYGQYSGTGPVQAVGSPGTGLIEIHDSLRALHAKIDWLQVNNNNSRGGGVPSSTGLLPTQFGLDSSAPLHEQLGKVSECLSLIHIAARGQDAAAKEEEELAKSRGLLTLEQQATLQSEKNQLSSRVDDLSARNDRLMNEKETLLASQHSALTMQADSSRRISELQQELEETRKDAGLFKSELTKARDALDILQTQMDATSCSSGGESAVLREKEGIVSSLEAANEQAMVDYSALQADHTATLAKLESLQSGLKTATAEAVEAKEKAVMLESDLQASKEATNQAIALAEEASQETEQLREELEAVMCVSGTDDVNGGSTTESIKTGVSTGTSETAQLLEKIRHLEEAEADLRDCRRVIFDTCTALARLSAEEGGVQGDGEAGPDRLCELVEIVVDRVATLSSTTASSSSSASSSTVVKEHMQAVYDLFVEVLENEGKESFTRGEVIKRIKAVLKRVSQQYSSESRT